MKQTDHPTARSTVPPGAMISNGRLNVVVSDAGTGQAKREWIALNRWYADPVEDAHGFFIFLRDLETGAVWSVGSSPVREIGARYEVSGGPGTFTITHENHGIEAAMTVAVAPTDDIEIRLLRLRDTTGRARRIEVTTYIEITLHHPAADVSHPAFAKLFVQTEAVAARRLLIARRRPRANSESWPCMFHGIVGGGDITWETDRLRFLGRGRGPERPAALDAAASLSGTVGNVLDSVFSLRTTLDIAAHSCAEVGFFAGAADDGDRAIDVAKRHGDIGALRAVLDAAGRAERTAIGRDGITEEEAALFQSLGVAILRGARTLRVENPKLSPDADINAVFGRLGICRDRPLLVATRGWADPDTARLLKARAYWAARGLQTHLAVLCDDAAGAPADLDDRVTTFRGDQLPAPDREALLAAADLVLADGLPEIGGPSSETPFTERRSLLAGDSNRAQARSYVSSSPAAAEALQFWNGYGGFSADGSEYVIRMPWRDGGLVRPPLPWTNVVANERCGFLVSESGAGYTWCRNSQANRLTPWLNDPVSDPHGEAVYIRDEDDGAFWSPMPGPAPAPCDYETRHGFGYSVFTCRHRGLVQETTLFVPRHGTVKFVRLRIANGGASRRSVSVFSYQRLVMGSVPSASAAIVTRHDPARGFLSAVNCAASDFRGGVAFSSAAISGAEVVARHFTCDRSAFIGQGGTTACPGALGDGPALDGASGAGLDPCFAHQIQITIDPGQTAECTFMLGECMSDAEAADVVRRYTDPVAVEGAIQEVGAFWRFCSSAVRVETPSPAINLMLNGWLIYQNLSCRIWGRSAFYQSGGAYGYRDQLQDTAGLIAIRPDITRAQILLHAAHQFPEGDVLHWWHPEPMETGMRTRFSDDLLWLPYVTAEYLGATGDASVLDERRAFVSAPALQPGEDEVYLKPKVTDETADIYEHCCRSIDRSLTCGAHGLPLMGTGDWNDGMNRIGREGRGESVWLGFFLHHVLDAFIPICERRGDGARARSYRSYRSRLAAALETAAWDGAWYRRAYYDDGTPLGSSENDECRIDALAQAWAVISGVASPPHAKLAMESLDRELVSERDGIIRLLAPPFVNTPKDPGYIKGYVAGVRENGGQYTHAACWVIRAFAEHGRNDRAARLLEMILPVTRAATAEAADRYKVEPYVIAADIYGTAPHVGRGGWTWYTGSAGWMFRVALESILGLRIVGGDRLVLRPRIPDDWPGFKITYRTTRGAEVRITVENPSGRQRRPIAAEFDGRPVTIADADVAVPLPRDGEHLLRIVLGDPRSGDPHIPACSVE